MEKGRVIEESDAYFEGTSQLLWVSDDGFGQGTTEKDQVSTKYPPRGDQGGTKEGPSRDQVGTKRDLLATLESLRDDFGVTFGT